MALVCVKCSTKITERQYLECCSCNKYFHLDCTNVSLSRFLIMTVDNKQTWTCDSCRLIKRKNANGNSPDNVTLRKKYEINISTDNSFEALSSSISDTDTECGNQRLNRSCPDITLNEQTAHLENKIQTLENKLMIAENEIQNLVSENYKLHNKIEKLTSICTTTRKRKRKSLNRTRLDFSHSEEQEKLEASLENPIISSNKHNVCASYPTIDGANQQELNRKESTATSSDGINTYEPQTEDPIYRPHYTTTDGAFNTNTNSKKHRIQIFGDDQGRGLCKMLQKMVGNKYKVTSDIKPGATTDKLLEYLLPTCVSYGKNDYVLILAGANDRNPLKQSSYLYYYLSQLSNTNIILCETQSNAYLNKLKINKLYELLSIQLENVNFVDLHYSYLGLPHDLLKHACKNILQEVLRLEYRHKLTFRYAELAKKLNKKNLEISDLEPIQKNTNITENKEGDSKNCQENNFFRE